MGYDFNADEIFRIAEQIERNGADFYSRFAEKTTDPPMRSLFTELASMEAHHEKTFSSMRSGLSERDREEGAFDPAEESAAYLQTLAGMSVVDDRAKKAFGLVEAASGPEGLASALRAAIDLEKESVVFYLGMKELVPGRLGKDKLDEIIKEEMKHIRILGSKLLSLGK
jgi:rubrerythrin